MLEYISTTVIKTKLFSCKNLPVVTKPFWMLDLFVGKAIILTKENYAWNVFKIFLTKNELEQLLKRRGWSVWKWGVLKKIQEKPEGVGVGNNDNNDNNNDNFPKTILF